MAKTRDDGPMSEEEKEFYNDLIKIIKHILVAKSGDNNEIFCSVVFS